MALPCNLPAPLEDVDATLMRARELDRLADLELATGRHAQAERLAQPVQLGWLSVALAEGALLMAALHECAEASEAVAAANDTQAMLRRTVTA